MGSGPSNSRQRVCTGSGSQSRWMVRPQRRAPSASSARRYADSTTQRSGSSALASMATPNSSRALAAHEARTRRERVSAATSFTIGPMSSLSVIGMSVRASAGAPAKDSSVATQRPPSWKRSRSHSASRSATDRVARSAFATSARSRARDPGSPRTRGCSCTFFPAARAAARNKPCGIALAQS